MIAARSALATAAILGASGPIRETALRLVAWMEAQGPAGAVLYGLAYVAACVLLVPGSLLTMGAGFLYGPVLGMLVVVPASTLGATATFLLARGVLGSWVRRRVAGRPVFAAIDRAVARRGFRTVLLLRLSPLLPFNLLNGALGLTSVRLRDYVPATLLGMLPVTLLFVHAGSLATDLARLQEAGPGSGARVALVAGGLVALLAVVVLVGRAARRALREDLDAPP